MRKKITMLLASLFLCMGAWAQLTTGQYYKIKNVTADLYLQVAGDNANMQLRKEAGTVLQLFQLEEADNGQYYIKSVKGETTYYAHASGWNFNATTTAENKTPYTIALVEGETNVYSLNQTTSDYTGNAGTDATDVASVVYCNKGVSQNGKWLFEAVDDPSEVTLETGKNYRLRSDVSGLYMQCVSFTQASGEGAFQLKGKSTEDGQIFQLEDAGEGKFYLKTVKEETTYYVKAESWNFFASTVATTPFTIAVAEGEYSLFSLKQETAAYTGYAGNTNNGATAAEGTYLYNNQPNLTGNTVWFFEEVSDEVVNVTYVYKYGDTEISRETIEAIKGAEFPAITTSFPFGVSATKPAGNIAESDVVEGNVTKTITLDVNTPFKFADSYENVSWYFLKFDSENNFFYLHHDAEQTYIDLESKSFEADNDNYYWGFVGNPFDGYQIVNKGAGKGYILSSSTTMAGTTGSGTWPIMTEMPVADGNNTLWIATSSSHGDNGFFLAQKDYPTNRMNNRDGKLAYWTGGAGAGSTFMVEEPEVAMAAVLAAFKENAPNTLGYVGGYSADKAEAIQAIETYEQMVDFEANNTKIALDVNKYYRIKNVLRNKVLSVNANNERVSADLNNAEISQIWKFEEGATEGTYLIKSSNADAYMLGVGASNTLAAEGAEFVLHNLTYGQFNLKQQNSNNLMCIYSGGGIGSWTGGGAGSDMAWYIVPATTIEYTLSDIDGEGYATAYLPFDVTLDEGVNAYAIESTNSTHAILAEKEDIPANEGAILIGTPGTHTFNIATASSEWTGNMLIGTTVNTYVEGAAYVLANGTNGVGLYKAAYNVSTDTTNDGEEGVEDDTYEAFLNNANKAYLPAPVGAEAAMFSFGRGEGTTAIDNVELANDNVVIYDLAGRRVEKMEKGIYIVNGKKVIK